MEIFKKAIYITLNWNVQSTFFGEASVEHQLSVSEIIEHWTEVCGVSVDQICSRLILEFRVKNQTRFL